MRIEFDNSPVADLVRFLEEHDLTLTIQGGRCRFTARVKGAEIKEGAMLGGASGDGLTPGAATRALARAIEGRLLVLNAYDTEHRREIRVPRLYADGAALIVSALNGDA